MRVTGDQHFDDRLLNDVSNSKRAVFVVGDLHYTDVFGKDWYATFVSALNDLALSDPNHLLAVWPDGNDST